MSRFYTEPVAESPAIGRLSAKIYDQGSQKDVVDLGCAHGAQITFGDLTPYITYVYEALRVSLSK